MKYYVIKWVFEAHDNILIIFIWNRVECTQLAAKKKKKMSLKLFVDYNLLSWQFGGTYPVIHSFEQMPVY